MSELTRGLDTLRAVQDTLEKEADRLPQQPPNLFTLPSADYPNDTNENSFSNNNLNNDHDNSPD